MEKKKSIIPGIVFLVLVALLGVGLVSCHISNKKWQNARDDFEERVAQTLDMYGNALQYSMNGSIVIIHINPERWEASSAKEKSKFAEDVCNGIKLDAFSSGIIKYLDVTVSFYLNDERLKTFTIKEKE